MATEAYIDGNKINDERPLAVLIAQYAPAWIESASANVRMWRKQWRRRRERLGR